jgi:hypothetical protein
MWLKLCNTYSSTEWVLDDLIGPPGAFCVLEDGRNIVGMLNPVTNITFEQMYLVPDELHVTKSS